MIKMNVFQNMKVDGIMMLNKNLLKFYIQINLFIKEILKTTNFKDMVLINGIMELDMMENGKMIDSKEAEKWQIPIAIFFREFSKIITLIFRKISI